MSESTGQILIDQLLADPEGFVTKGKGIRLLQEYFRGFDVDTLRQLLHHDNRIVKSEAISIISELGQRGSSLVDDITPFLHDNDRSIRYDVLESIMLFSDSGNSDRFWYVIQSMTADDPIIRVRAMYLVSNANIEQLRAALAIARNEAESSHVEGLMFLLKLSPLNVDEVHQLLQSSDAICRKYAAIAAKKEFLGGPELIRVATTNNDADIRRFADYVLEMEGG